MQTMTLDIAQLFLVAVSILAVALADARTEPLKTGLSVVGALLSIGWGFCNIELLSWPPGGNVELVLSILPALVLLGWLIAVVVHGRRWNRGDVDQMEV